MAEVAKKPDSKMQKLQKMQAAIAQEEQKRAKGAADALWSLYVAGKTPPEIAAICEKYLAGYWDSEFTIKITSKKAKKKAGAKAKATPSS